MPARRQAQVLRKIRFGDCFIEHNTKRHTVYWVNVHAEADDPPREEIHNNENPVRFQDDGFAAKKIDAPKAIFGVTDEGQPRRTAACPS